MSQAEMFRASGSPQAGLKSPILSRLLAKAGRVGRASNPNASAAEMLQHIAASLQAGRITEGVEQCGLTLKDNPGFAGCWSLMGMAYGLAHDHESALLCHQMSVRLSPNFAEGQYQVAQTANLCGKPDLAVKAAMQAVRLSPDMAKAWFVMGLLQNEAGQYETALKAHETAFGLAPTPEAQLGRGNALRALRRPAEAIKAYETALAIKPDYVDALTNLGCVAQEIGDLGKAESAFRSALSINPAFEPAWRNLGTLFHLRGEFGAASEAYATGLQYAPDDAELLGYIGSALSDLGLPDEGEPFFERALALAPNHAKLRFNHGVARLKAGDWLTGWADHEARWRGIMPPHHIAQPMWDGGDAAGKTILLHAEQGLGDTLQFVRYAPMIAQRGGNVLLEVQKPLLKLLRDLPGVSTIIATGDPRPPFDLHCPMMSLPYLFRTTPDNAPSTPYLMASAEVAAAWRTRVPAGSRPKIGLVWAGNPRPNELASHYADKRRSISLETLRPVLSSVHADWYSLQIGDAAGQLSTTDGLPAIRDLTSDIHDFADTAGLVSCLDAVATVDTSTAHLAAGMGKPTFMLSRADSCWRWMLHTDRTPWYPSMRIFRQEVHGDWQQAIDQLAEALRLWVEDYGRSAPAKN